MRTFFFSFSSVHDWLIFLTEMTFLTRKLTHKRTNNKSCFFVYFQWYNKLKGDSTEEPAGVTEVKGNSRLVYKAERAESLDQDAEWIPF